MNNVKVGTEDDAIFGKNSNGDDIDAGDIHSNSDIHTNERRQWKFR